MATQQERGRKCELKADQLHTAPLSVRLSHTHTFSDCLRVTCFLRHIHHLCSCRVSPRPTLPPSTPLFPSFTVFVRPRQPTHIPLSLPEDVGDVRVQTEDPDHQWCRDQYEGPGHALKRLMEPHHRSTNRPHVGPRPLLLLFLF